MTVRPPRLRFAPVFACLLALAAFPSLASGAMSDRAAARRVAWAQHDYETGHYDVAADRLEKVLKKRPDAASASVLLCRVRAAAADVWERMPADDRVVRGRFEDAARACSRASSVDAAPEDRAFVRRAWARAVEMSDDEKDAVAAYRAWSEAAPDDPHAVGGLAAWLDLLGKPSEADAVLAHALETSEAFAHRVRFEYACRTAEPKRKGRLEPLLETLLQHEHVAAGKAMIGVLETIVRRGFREGELTFLDAIAAKRIDDADAHYLWNCMGGEASLAEPDDSSSPPPGMTFPKRKAWPEPTYPESMRGAARSGRALVLGKVETDGTVGFAWVALATSPAFGKAAAQAMRRSRFVPASKNGRPIPYAWLFQFRFKMGR